MSVAPGASCQLPVPLIVMSVRGAPPICKIVPPLAEPHTVYMRDSTGKVVESVTGVFYPYGGEIAGGYMLVPMTGTDFSSIEVVGSSVRAELDKTF